MASVIKSISFTKEEKEILTKAKDILKKICDELEDGELVADYENSEYITNIFDMPFEYWYWQLNKKML